MGKGLRLTERWMHRALWLIAFAFAWFLIGLGGKIVDNLGDLAPSPPAEHFLDRTQAARVEADIARAQAAQRTAQAAVEQAEQKHHVAQANTRSAHETFDNWIATRHATVRPEQDAELIARTRELDKLAAAERAALAAVQAQEQAKLDAAHAEALASGAMETLMQPAREMAYAAAQRAEIKAFVFRLMVTLPLLLVAAWLFKKKRHSTYWPFVWGFIFFALFAFFFELVPYLPSYGGYVRYAVGIVLTIVAGRYAIIWLQGYLARQKAAEALPETERRGAMRYETALGRMAKGMCPACERGVDYKDEHLAHCPHCGIQVFNRCTNCNTRKNAFARFCFSCGTATGASLAD